MRIINNANAGTKDLKIMSKVQCPKESSFSDRVTHTILQYAKFCFAQHHYVRT